MNDLIDSEAMIAAILAYLLPNGIRRVDLSIQDLTFHGGKSGEDRLFLEAMLWLEQEGVIRYQSVTMDGRFCLCVLTAYGFSLLGQRFSASGDDRSVGQAIKEVSEGRAPFAGLGEFFGGLLGAFTKSIGS